MNNATKPANALLDLALRFLDRTVEGVPEPMRGLIVVPVLLPTLVAFYPITLVALVLLAVEDLFEVVGKALMGYVDWLDERCMETLELPVLAGVVQLGAALLSSYAVLLVLVVLTVVRMPFVAALRALGYPHLFTRWL